MVFPLHLNFLNEHDLKFHKEVVPEVCIQQFAQVGCHCLYNRPGDQIHGTLLYPKGFSSQHQKLVGPSHPMHLNID